MMILDGSVISNFNSNPNVDFVKRDPSILVPTGIVVVMVMVMVRGVVVVVVVVV